MTDAQRIERDRILHTFGNLTLLTQALNSSTSNGPFHSYTSVKSGELVSGKRQKISSESLLKMNAYFQNLAGSEWNESAILNRAGVLFNQAAKLWYQPATQTG